jgi:hypothetical protein
MKEQIKSLKLNLKEIAHTIKNQKTLRKKSHPHHDKYKGDYPLLRLREEYRHKHVAYCLTRGRTIEQVDGGKGLDMERVNWIVKTMQPDSREKLYVVVNDSLTPSQQAVQSAHAVAEFMKNNPYSMWRNGYLILLKDKPNYSKDMFGWVSGHCEYAEFREPDLENKVTAYAIFGKDAERAMKSKVLL